MLINKAISSSFVFVKRRLEGFECGLVRLRIYFMTKKDVRFHSERGAVNVSYVRAGLFSTFFFKE